MPKIWGVIKFETNLEALKNIGIDLKLAGVLEVNTTKTDKTRDHAAQGYSGQRVRAADHDRRADHSLDAGTLPAELAALFTGANSSARGAHDVVTIIGGQLWRIIDHGDGDRQFFVRLKDAATLTDSASNLQLVLQNDLQTFTLRRRRCWSRPTARRSSASRPTSTTRRPSSAPSGSTPAAPSR